MDKSLNLAMVVRLFSPSGGLEFYAHRLVQGLLEKGHKVTVLCQDNESKLVHANLTIKTSEKEPAGLSKAEKIRHRFASLSALVRENGPFELVHSQHCPIDNADVVTFHQHTVKRFSITGYPSERFINDAKCRLNPAYKLRYEQDEILLKSTRLRIFVSEVCRRDYFETYGLTGREADFPYSFAPCGAEDLKSLDTIDSKKFGSPFTFLFIGKGYRKKGLDTLFRALSILKRKGLHNKLIVIGMKPSPLNKSLALLNGIADRVELLGYQKDLSSYQDKSDTIVVPSKCEAFGMSPIEAMLRGVVPIVSQVCGISEYLQDGEDALILKDQLSAEELASLMEKLQTLARTNPEKLEEMRKKAIAKASTLTWQQTVDMTENAYLKLLGK
jgi:Glycosyltransferase